VNSRAQAGLEYLITYGWAIVLVAAVIGTLVLVVGTPLAEGSFSSSDPTKLMIKGAAVENNVATIKLQNITGGEIDVQRVTGTTGYYDCIATNTSNTIVSGGELEIKCSASPNIAQGDIEIEYVDASGLLQNTLLSGGGVAMGAPPTGENSDYLCSDGFDNDGDYLVDCLDPDCDDLTGQPGGALCEFDEEETCDDGFDNDADGNIDIADSDCVPAEICNNTIDDDLDSFVDCLDSDCFANPVCLSSLGEACNTGDECSSGFCTDNVCCNSACDGTCQSCAFSGNEGTCSGEDIGEGQCLGPELVTNGTFSDGETGWNFSDYGWSVVNEQARYYPDPPMPFDVELYPSPSIGIQSGKAYRISYDIVTVSGPFIAWITAGSHSFWCSSPGCTPETQQEDFTATSSGNFNIFLLQEGPSETTFTFDNVSVKEKYTE